MQMGVTRFPSFRGVCHRTLLTALPLYLWPGLAFLAFTVAMVNNLEKKLGKERVLLSLTYPDDSPSPDGLSS